MHITTRLFLRAQRQEAITVISCKSVKKVEISFATEYKEHTYTRARVEIFAQS